ncbi:MAG: hypothetical protein OEY57_05920 [Nitrospirota bacterium]|nr:hypothetical protein [Nitrospirota bacterium]
MASRWAVSYEMPFVGSVSSHITILTFNYDRSLEFYLSTIVGKRAKKEPEAATVRIGGADQVVIADGPTVIHLHGQLRGSYSSTWSNDRLDADGLLLLSSADQGFAEFERGRAAIRACRALYFLGFGFNPKSTRRLGDFTDASVVNNMEISGTHVGFTEREWNEIPSGLFPLGWNERQGWKSVHEFVRENQI